MDLLPRPDVLRCTFDKTAQPNLPVMELQWDPDAPGVMDRNWYLPENVVLKGPAPTRFGVTIHRQSTNSFRVRVLWNQLQLAWENLTRTQILCSALASLLQSLGTDLWYLLEQPVSGEEITLAAA